MLVEVSDMKRLEFLDRDQHHNLVGMAQLEMVSMDMDHTCHRELWHNRMFLKIRHSQIILIKQG